MGYVGNQQTEGFSQVPAKQDLTGATGTSLTLTHAVASAEGIDLFINNVRQEPTTAYSVGGDGVTVTLTGSVVATDDIYVVYNSLARQTSTHPSNQALQATSGTFSGDLTVDTNTLYVDSTNNRVGIGTSSPSHILHTSGTGQTAKFESSNNSYQIELNYNNNTSRAFVGSFSNGLVFAPSSASEAMRIDSSGSLLVGTASASSPFDGCRIAIDANSSDGIRVRSGGVPMRFIATGTSTFVGSISTTASATSYNTSSDYRLKENVVANWDATTRLKQLNPVRFNFIADPDTTVDGFLAHEVQDVVPEAISGTKDAMMDEEYEVTPAVLDEDGNVVTPAVMGTRSVPDYQGIDQSKLTPLLTKALIEAVEKIEQLETRITALEAN